MPCDITALMAQAAEECVSCLTTKELEILQTKLLCDLSSGGGVISGYTPESVLFVGAGGGPDEDPGNFTYNETDRVFNIAGLQFGGKTPADVVTTPGTPGGFTNSDFPTFGFSTSSLLEGAGTSPLVSALPSGGNTTIATTGVGGLGPFFFILAGKGGEAPNAAVSSTGGAGGPFSLQGGYGGDASVDGTGTNTGGAGGTFAMLGGKGGMADGVTTGTNTGGTGGSVSIKAGFGGVSANGASNVGGTGGSIAIEGGTGGLGTSSGGNGGPAFVRGGTAAAMVGAAGGDVTIEGRAGSVTGSGGAGGALTLTGGNAGGDNTVNRAGGAITITSGTSKGSSVGAPIAITAGNGGLGTGATGAVGGAITITAGTGGANAGTSGAGGDVTISAGIGGASGTPGAGGAIIFETAVTTARAEVGRFGPATGNLQLANSLSWGATSSGAQDVFLVRDAANTLAQRNGTSAQAFHIYDTYTNASNFERGFVKFLSNNFLIRRERLGTGTSGNLDLCYGNASSVTPVVGIRIPDTSASITLDFGLLSTVGISGPLARFASGAVFNASSGVQTVLAITPTYNQTGTAGATDLLINRAETAIGSGVHLLLDAQVASASKFTVDRLGAITVGGGAAINKISKVLQGSATFDPANVPAETTAVLGTITVTGAAVGDCVFIGLPDAWASTNMIFKPCVTAINTVSLYGTNPNGLAGINLPSDTVKVYVHQQ